MMDRELSLSRMILPRIFTSVCDSLVHLLHTKQGNFYWKIHLVYRLALSTYVDTSLTHSTDARTLPQLFSMSDLIHPMAYRESVTEQIATFVLVIHRELENITDYIISTFLVLEQRLRMGEKGSEIALGIAASEPGMVFIRPSGGF